MLYAKKDDLRLRAFPGGRASCPICGEEVLAKCGEIKTWHWAHMSVAECDTWAEGETEWHARWKGRWPAELTEVVYGKHRADVVTKGGLVIEFQHSGITPAQIAERELFYGPMVWVFDAVEAWASDRLLIRDRGNYETFRWKHPIFSLASAKRRVYLDVGDDVLFAMKKMYPGPPYGGWGKLMSLDEFLAEVNGWGNSFSRKTLPLQPQNATLGA